MLTPRRIYGRSALARRIGKTHPSPFPKLTRPYGSGQNGCPGDKRAQYSGKGSPSLHTMARREGGHLSALWAELFMGFPPGWSER